MKKLPFLFPLALVAIGCTAVPSSTSESSSVSISSSSETESLSSSSEPSKWEKTKTVDGVVVPDFSTDKRVELTAYGSPKYNEATADFVYGKLQEAGFNKIIPLFDGRDAATLNTVRTRFSKYLEDTTNTKVRANLKEAIDKNAQTVNQKNIVAIKKAKEYGLDTIVIQEGIYDGPSIFAKADLDIYTMIQSRYIDNLKDYEEIDGYAGFFLTDEPREEERFEKIGACAKYFKKKKFKGYPLVNLLARVDKNFSYESYDDYIDMYWKYIYDYLNYVSFDIYPLNLTADETSSYIKSWHLTSTEVCANHLKESNNGGTLKSYVDCPGEDCWDKTIATKSADYMRFKIYTQMAYGSTEMEFYELTYEGDTETKTNYVFNYKDPTKMNTETFNCIKEANLELKTFDSVYRNFNYDNTITYGTSDSFTELRNNVSSYNSLTSISEKNNNPTLCGCLTDGENDAFMVVNYQNPDQKVKDSAITMNFKSDYDHVLVYQNGEEHVYETNNGEYVLNIKGVSGALVIPLDL